ncbi:MAG: hypothetical protein OEV64_13520 [Desulfobulbaceae bacterium]|nr:hypothetical protein [Desulfobulbaceae bacterium]
MGGGKKTERGFDYFKFKDLYGKQYSIQKSSLATENAIWLGIDDAEPKIMASKVIDGGTGWAKYPIHDDVVFNTRMHLSQKHVKDLINILQKFVDTGDIQHENEKNKNET